MADYISREAAIALAKDLVLRYEDGTTYKHRCIDPQCIRELPAADVRPVVKARWEDETGYIFNLLAQRVYCPACKSYAYFYPITMKNYCPNCGAEMRAANDRPYDGRETDSSAGSE